MLPLEARAQDAGAGALFAAIRANDIETVKQIVASGADPRARDANGMSAPQAAVRMGHHRIAQFLLSYRRPKSDPPGDDAIDRALDRAVAETEQSSGPIPDAAPPEAADAPVTLPEPSKAAVAPAPDAVPAPAEIADLRDAPAVPPHDENTPVIEPLPADSQAQDGAPLALDPNRVAAPAGERSGTPAPTDSAAAKKSEEAEPGLLAKAKGWLGGLLGFERGKAAPAETAEAAPKDLIPPGAPPAHDTATDTSGRDADAPPAGNVPLEGAPGSLPDLDKLAAQNNPQLEAADPNLPEADLPRAIAQAPVPDDPLAAALAQREGAPASTDSTETDSLLALLDGPADQAAPPAAKAAEPSKTLDLMSMAPKERLAWLDKLLSSPVARDAEETLAESKDEALSHLRERARRKAAAIAAEQAALDAEEKKNLKTDLSAVDGPPPGTNLQRKLKIPLPPPDPKGRKNFARDPWFRDVSPDEPDVRAAHRSLKAAPPERGSPPPEIPKVPQLQNRTPGEDQFAKVAGKLPEPPPIRESATPTAPANTAGKVPNPADALDALEKEFGATPPANDPLAAELGLGNPKGAKPAVDPLAAELGLDNPKDAKPAADPLAAELGLGEPAGDAKQAADAGAAGDPNDPLSQALGDLTSLIEGDTPKGQNPAEAETPVATPTEILAALPPGSQVRLDVDGRPLLPAAWTLPVVLPGQTPPLQDLASAYITPANFRAGFEQNADLAQKLGPVPPGANAASAWPVTKIKMADGKEVSPAPNPAAKEEAALPVAPRAIDGRALSLGTGASLYNTFIPAGAKGGEGRAPECIEKAGGRTQFCIKELQWPAFLEPRFLVSTILYTGTASVVRFDDGAPTRMHVVFSSDGFDEITDWLVRRFGPPTSTVTRSVAPFGQGRRDNPTMMWRAVDQVTGKNVVLEIRHYDDTRDGFPDIRNGVMMLYREDAPGIFPQVSVHELMRLKRTG